MSAIQIITLLLAGFGAGIVNSVAGGGALIIFPILLSMGISPKLANATTSIGVYGGQFSSAYGYKKFLRNLDKRLFLFLAIGVFGGGIGAFALDKTSNDAFKQIAPWFVLFAVVLLSLQPILSPMIIKFSAKNKSSKSRLLIAILVVLMLAISVYGGYFGAGMGIVIFAILGFVGIKNVNQINGTKNLITISVNTAANVYFVSTGFIKWDAGLWLFAGSAIGGFIGSKTASRLPAKTIRTFVIICGLAATIILFSK